MTKEDKIYLKGAFCAIMAQLTNPRSYRDVDLQEAYDRMAERLQSWIDEE